MFLGVDSSDCPLPCRTFSTEVKFFSKLDELVGFGLFFLPTVEVGKVPLVHFLDTQVFLASTPVVVASPPRRWKELGTEKS